jgi:hypothetical protein
VTFVAKEASVNGQTATRKHAQNAVGPSLVTEEVEARCRSHPFTCQWEAVAEQDASVEKTLDF